MEIKDTRLTRFSEAEFLKVLEENPLTCTVRLEWINNKWEFDETRVIDMALRTAATVESSYGPWSKVESSKTIITCRSAGGTYKYKFNYGENPLNVVRSFYYNEDCRVLIRVARIADNNLKNACGIRLAVFKIF